MSNFFNRLQALRESRPMPNILTVRSENSNYSPYHAAGKNCCRLVGHIQSEDCYYSSLGAELDYMCHSGVTLFNSNFCSVCWYSQNLECCEYVFNSHDCFGCVSRNHAEYEILNQKYSKDEYFKKVAQIKDELKADGSYGRWWWPSPYEEVKPFSSYMA